MGSFDSSAAPPLAEVRVFLMGGDVRSPGDRDEVDIGVVRFGAMQVHALPSPRYVTDAYLVRVMFDVELAPEVPGPDWAEVGLEFGGGACVLDAVPRSVEHELTSRTYTLSQQLLFSEQTMVSAADGRAFVMTLEGLSPMIKAFGIGRRALRWRHIATAATGVPVGSHIGWLVLETPANARELTVRFSAAYQLSPSDAMGLVPGNETVERVVSLPEPDGRARRTLDVERDRARRVFLIHGRDDEVASRMRELLSLLGLRVMEWEPLVAEAGQGPAPILSDVIHDGMSRAQAIVALLTPDDVVSLHSDLRHPREDPHELTPSCQPRPNVLMELGAALFVFRQHTVVVKVGGLRPMADLGGVAYVDFDGGEVARQALIQRLRVAGCEVDDSGTEWARAERFHGLGAFTRQPPMPGIGD
ncbi:TIR domain-containing protein [Nonomuraea sp. NPDC050663]|uniref:TIR domain-containing protein n=1 Tax=Nonomuraea sp. NPDC050663 TaxID=3364370 RepID=UPI0037993395